MTETLKKFFYLSGGVANGDGRVAIKVFTLAETVRNRYGVDFFALCAPQIVKSIAD